MLSPLRSVRYGLHPDSGWGGWGSNPRPADYEKHTPRTIRATCTDATEHRTDSTRGAASIRRPGPRTGPRGAASNTPTTVTQRSGRNSRYAGSPTIVGDEADDPYDRMPLSKQVLTGSVPAEGTALPHVGELDADWRTGTHSHAAGLPGTKSASRGAMATQDRDTSGIASSSVIARSPSAWCSRPSASSRAARPCHQLKSARWQSCHAPKANAPHKRT